MTAPLMSCITTYYNERDLVTRSIDSLLNQTFSDFELILVDDGSDDGTYDWVRAYDDARIHLIRQANDGLSAARNKALEQARGEYVCFLDADDSRPFWAFERVAEVISSASPDLILCRGVLSEARGELVPFYDDWLFKHAEDLIDGELSIAQADPRFQKLLPILQFMEPQSANKVVRTNLIRQHGILFPNGHFFEDMLFHTACIVNARRIGLINDPMFTYYQQYGRPQVTATTSDLRFDALAVGRMTLDYFIKSGRSSNVLLRTAVLLSSLKIIDWCGDTISHQYRFHFKQIRKALLMELDERYFSFPLEKPDYFSSFSGALNDLRNFVRQERTQLV